MQELLTRFYGGGAKRDFGQVLGVYVRKPYAATVEELESLVGRTAEDLTDVNDETSFSYLLEPYVVSLSMVGPFALVLRKSERGDSWLPVEPGADGPDGEIVARLERNGFMVLGPDALETVVELWGDEPPVPLYNLLFVTDSPLPWAST